VVFLTWEEKMFDFYYAVTHHLELIHITQLELAARSATAGGPGLKDRVYLHLGDLLISLGERLRQASMLEHEFAEKQEGSIPDLLQEYS
jgi:hypothetical protein